MQSTTMRHHSVLVEYNSQQATSKSPKYGNGQFTCTLNNTNNLTHSIKVTPHKTIIPNVFNNVNEYNNYVEFVWFDPVNNLPEPAGKQNKTVVTALGGQTLGNMNIPIGFYTLQGVMTAFNDAYAAATFDAPLAAMKGGLTAAIATSNTVDKKVSLSLSAGTGGADWDPAPLYSSLSPGADAGFAIRASRDFFELMGWTNMIYQKDAAGMCYIWLSWLNAPVLTTYPWLNVNSQISANTKITQIPRVGGEHVVHIAIGEAAPGNMVCSDSKSRDILLTCSMHDVPYGQFMAFEAKDLYVDDIDYKTVTNLHQAQISLLDHKFRVLTVPENYPVSIILKVFHNDTHTM